LAIRRPRITIATLLDIVAFVAVAFASVLHPTDAWDSGVFGLLLLVLLTSKLLAVHRAGARRSFWLGFSLFGWAYFGLSLVPPIEARLPTTKTLALTWEKLPKREILWDDDLTLTNVRSFDVKPVAPVTLVAPSPAKVWDIVVYSPPASSPNTYIKRLVTLAGDSIGNFVRIGHSLVAMVFAMVGGTLSRRLYFSGRPRRGEESDVPRPTLTESVDD
jgi:hypothetical protein